MSSRLDKLNNDGGTGTAPTFEAVAAYLLAAGWYQDGQDPGLWLPDKVTIGTALETQLERDGFSPSLYRPAWPGAGADERDYSVETP